MSATSTFDKVLEAVEHLRPDEQADLIAVVQRRLAEEGRRRVVAEVQQGRADFQSGRAIPGGVEDVMREIES
ncbi:MAG: hypothetical protein U1E05_05490 [Patescibacteria group bacterium]|nr:hypothetical protein [Patescibacteria group bacterium]